MFRSRQFKFILSGVVLLTLSACTIKAGKNGDVSTKKYNALVNKYNALLDKSYDSSEDALRVNAKLSQLNQVLKAFAQSADQYLSDNSGSGNPAQLEQIRDMYKSGLSLMSDVEVLMLQEAQSLRSNSENLYKSGSARFAAIKEESAALDGVRMEHNLIMQEIERRAGNSYQGHSSIVPQSPAPIETKQIVIEKAEAPVVATETGGAVYRDENGTLSTTTAGNFISFAGQRGYERSKAEDSFTIASNNRGVVGLACSNVDLIKVLNDLVSHMKGKLNSNSDDLELAFAIDYSGSMDNNIDYVLRRLGDFAEHLKSIKASGRGVRVAVVTFGESGRQKVELPFTSDLMQFSEVLNKLLTDYRKNNHSMDPGEAIYGGLDLITKELSFSSKNRQVIAITDEGSYELRTGNTSYVREVESRLSAISVYPLLVRYCN